MSSGGRFAGDITNPFFEGDERIGRESGHRRAIENLDSERRNLRRGSVEQSSPANYVLNLGIPIIVPTVPMRSVVEPHVETDERDASCAERDR